MPCTLSVRTIIAWNMQWLQWWLWALRWVFQQGRMHNCLVQTVPRDSRKYHVDEITANNLIFIEKLFSTIISVEWTKGICHTWSRGQHFSPSLLSCPVTTGIWNSALPKSDHRAEISGNIVRYDTLAPGPEILLSFTSIYGNCVL